MTGTLPAIGSISPIAVDDKNGRLAVRSTIEGFQKSMQELMGSERGDGDEINANGLKEYFVGGAYTRALLIPKDTTIVSQLWNKDRLWIIANGDVSFTTELGSRRVQGPFIEVAPFGTKVALYAHEDTLWIAVTGAESDNSADIEKEVIAGGYDELSYPWDMIEHDGDTL